MTDERFFIDLLHRLQDYDDAMVLYTAIQQQADQTEFKTSSTRIALDLLGNNVEKKQVQRALRRLADHGLIQVRTHANYRTYISVDRDAVNALLRIPVSNSLPGLRSDSFPFLDDLNARAAAQAKDAADSAIKRMAQGPNKPSQDGSNARD